MAIEIPSRYGYLDSDAYANGAPGSSALRREVSRNSNRLICRSGIMDSFVAPSTADIGTFPTTPDCQFRGFGSQEWRLIRGPVEVLKKPGTKKGLVTASFLISENGASDNRMYMQIATRARPYDPAMRTVAAGAFELRHNSGAWGDYYFETELDAGPEEEFSYYINGGITAELATLHGSSTGTGVAGALSETHLYGSATGWTAGLETGYYIQFNGAIDGNPIFVIQRVVSTTELIFAPALPNGRSSAGLTFSIYELGSYQWGSLGHYWKERSR